MALPLDVGFYGKLPSHGDFLRRRTSDAFVAVWDGWLQDCLAASRSALGDRWLELYLTSPAWRFVCGAGACGVAPVAGVMVPSVDRVGRYFPLTLVAELPAGADVLAVAAAAEPFMTDVERLAIDTLEAEAIDLEAFDEHLRASAARLAGCCTPPPVSLDPSAAGILDGDGETAVQMAVGSPPRLAPVLLQVLAHRLAAVYEPLTLWWTDGSAAVEPSGLICRGLPDPESFASLLDGAWTGRRWWAIPSQDRKSVV